MNLALIDPFVLAQDYPDTLTGTLSTFTSFDRIYNYWGNNQLNVNE